MSVAADSQASCRSLASAQAFSERCRRLVRFAAAAWLFTVAAIVSSPASAHDAWIALPPAGPEIRFGHVGEPEALDATRVRQVEALDADGKVLTVVQVPGERAVRLTIEGRAALIALAYDNGYWTRAPGASASVNLPRNEVAGARSGAHVVKFGKTVVQWSPVVTRPLGQVLEIVPLAESAPAAGDRLAVRVLWQGRPLAGARVLYDSAAARPPVARADDTGRAEVPVSRGSQFLSVSHRAPLADDPRADSESVSANLVFEGR